MLDPHLDLLPDDPPVDCWRGVTPAAVSLDRPPPGCPVDAAAWADALAHQGVWCEGHPGRDHAPAGARLAVYTFRGPPPPLPTLPAERVLLDRDGVVAVHKPAGLTTQRTRVSAHRNLEALLRAALGDPDLRAVHRLDRDTSGVVLFARDRASTAALHAQFRERSVDKRYLARVAPAPREPAFRADGPLERVPAPSTEPAPLVFRVGDGPDARPSVTDFTVLRRGADDALLEARPLTGRTHQIRVHLADRGHPILGDVLYGDGASAPRLMLHAARLTLEIGGRVTTLRCPAAPAFD
ncbi:MAG: RNA pseudouridine synthase [Myxococcales bacterium]|nr:RNA pseudouridine synthase [Myxococcales bacterium]